jgi:hypothetical protein
MDPGTVAAATQRLLAYARAADVLSLADLIQQTAGFATPDDIYVLIASGQLYVDLYAEPLGRTGESPRFPGSRCADAPRRLGPSDSRIPFH